MKEQVSSLTKVETPDYRDILENELFLRKQRNIRYSLRAFARDLNVSASHLSGVFSGSAELSVANSTEIATRLGFSPREIHYFVNAVRLTKTSDKREKRLIEAEMLAFVKMQKKTSKLSQKQYEPLASWQNRLLLSAAYISRFSGKISEIAAWLSMPVAAVESLYSSLADLGIIERIEGTVKPISTPPLPSDYLSHVQKNKENQQLNDAMGCLANLPSPTESSQQLIFVRINEKHIDEMQTFLVESLDEFVKKFEKDPAADEVYGLSFQFFPVV